MTSRSFCSISLSCALSTGMRFALMKALRAEPKIRAEVLVGGGWEATRSWMTTRISSSTLRVPANKWKISLSQSKHALFQTLDLRLPCRELVLTIFLLIDDAGDSEDEILDFATESLVALSILLDVLYRSGSILNQSKEYRRCLRTCMSSQILDASSAADLRFSPMSGTKPSVLERSSSTSRA
jgi:hypothetical protein